VSDPAALVPTAKTVTLSPWIYGPEGPALDDFAESFHEASKLYPNVLDHRVRGMALLERRVEMRATAARSVKRYLHMPEIALPDGSLPPSDLGAAITGRRSTREFASASIGLDELAALLAAAYGPTGASAGEMQRLRAVPSAGALYPLELYIAATRVEELEPALYHFDPLRHVLERLRAVAHPEDLAPLTAFPQLFTDSAIVVFITGMFWRTRFKYGQRGYRFTLLEAGHVGQNLVLAATALELASVAVGGFFDCRIEALLGIDGVNEAPVYAVAVGRPELE
jgi:SagB-type dehydrogenase family enzyme